MEQENYATLVQSVLPRVVFVKTEIPITKDNFAELRENLITDDDTPEFSEDTVFFPLCVKSFPRVLSRMTASRAGWWAMERCRAVGWRTTQLNINSCLSNLEMDL